MSFATTKRPRAVWLWVLLGLVLFAGANVHLVYVAIASQPDCVAHARLGEGDAKRGVLGAARSSCASLVTGSAR